MKYVIALTCTLVFCSFIQNEQLKHNNAIYRIVINDFSKNASDSTIVLLDSTSRHFIYPGYGAPTGNFFHPNDSVLVTMNLYMEFAEENKIPTKVSDAYHESTEYPMISGAKYLEIFKDRDIEQNWRKYHSAYPNSMGIYSISKIKYIQSQNLAIVYIDVHCGMLCGEGKMYLLQLKNNKWEIIASDRLWVS